MWKVLHYSMYYNQDEILKNCAAKNFKEEISLKEVIHELFT
jgi:hypothetical protein